MGSRPTSCLLILLVQRHDRKEKDMCCVVAVPAESKLQQSSPDASESIGNTTRAIMTYENPIR